MLGFVSVGFAGYGVGDQGLENSSGVRGQRAGGRWAVGCAVESLLRSQALWVRLKDLGFRGYGLVQGSRSWVKTWVKGAGVRVSC